MSGLPLIGKYFVLETVVDGSHQLGYGVFVHSHVPLELVHAGVIFLLKPVDVRPHAFKVREV